MPTKRPRTGRAHAKRPVRRPATNRNRNTQQLLAGFYLVYRVDGGVRQDRDTPQAGPFQGGVAAVYVFGHEDDDRGSTEHWIFHDEYGRLCQPGPQSAGGVEDSVLEFLFDGSISSFGGFLDLFREERDLTYVRASCTPIRPLSSVVALSPARRSAGRGTRARARKK